MLCIGGRKLLICRLMLINAYFMLGQTTECGKWKDGAFCIKGAAYFVHTTIAGVWSSCIG